LLYSIFFQSYGYEPFLGLLTGFKCFQMLPNITVLPFLSMLHG